MGKVGERKLILQAGGGNPRPTLDIIDLKRILQPKMGPPAQPIDRIIYTNYLH